MTDPGKSQGLRPDFCFSGVVDIDPRWIAERGIEGLLLDIDNTITRWEKLIVPDEAIEWLKTLPAYGIKLRLLSNGWPGKKTKVMRQTGIDHVATIMIKPFPMVFRAALAELELAPAKVMMVGDSIFTDILPANRLGIWTCLVDPLSDVDFPGTKVHRLIENVFHLRDPLLPAHDMRRKVEQPHEIAPAPVEVE